MKKYILSNWQVIVVLLFSLAIIWPLFVPGYFSHHDDLQVMRIFEMHRCLIDFQIPCRWVPDMGNGYGFPLFNYYAPLPYYFGAVASFILGYVGSAKLLFLLPLFSAGFFMYLLVKELWDKNAAVVSGVLYSLAPYRAVDAYVRGAIGESWAIAVFPLIFYFSLKLIRLKKPKQQLYVIGLTAALFVLFTSHNIMSLLFLPIFLFWVIYRGVVDGFKNIGTNLAALCLGLGTSAFFLLPAFFERSLIQQDLLTTLAMDFRGHFVSLKQLLLDRSWGYGSSQFGEADTMSFQVGYLQWILAGTALVGGLTLVIKKKFRPASEILFFGLVFLITLFMTHYKSAFIWENITLLKYVQFPWRFLSISIFAAAVLSGFMFNWFKTKLKYALLMLILILTFLLNWNYFRPDRFYPLTDSQKLSGEMWKIQQKGSLLDYLPQTAAEPLSPAPDTPLVTTGNAQIKNYILNSKHWQFETTVSQDSRIEVPVFDYPNWQVRVNKYPYSFTHNQLGLISLDLQPGTYQVEGNFLTTPIRRIANVISLLSFALIGVYLVYGKTT